MRDTLQAGFLYCIPNSIPIPRAVYVCGPTASGKSSLAIKLSEQLNGEIINADAYQLYRGLEIISAAPDDDELAAIPHHLYGVLEPSESCDAMLYRKIAQPVIAEVQSRGKTPIITGGSGMYLKFLTHGPSPVPSGDDNLRRELEQKSDDALIERLSQLDPKGAEMTNLKNRRYLIRALEICILSGRKMSEVKNDWKKSSAETEKKLRGAYLLWDRETLRQRINQRTEVMLNSGAIEEVETLTDTSSTCEKAIGVPQIRALLSGELTREQCVDRIAAATRQYAKRQRTWFGKEAWLTSYSIKQDTDMSQLSSKIASVFKSG